MSIYSSEIKRKGGHLDRLVCTKKACKSSNFFIRVYLSVFCTIFAGGHQVRDWIQSTVNKPASNVVCRESKGIHGAVRSPISLTIVDHWPLTIDHCGRKYKRDQLHFLVVILYLACRKGIHWEENTIVQQSFISNLLQDVCIRIKQARSRWYASKQGSVAI